MNKKTISKNVQRHVHGYWHTSAYMHIKLLGHKISTLNFFFFNLWRKNQIPEFEPNLGGDIL